MGSGCAKSKKRNDLDFFEQYEKYAPKEAAKTRHHSDVSAPSPVIVNGIKPQLRNSVEQLQKVVRLSTTSAPSHESRIDWTSLEKSIQVMNLKLLRDDLNQDPHQFLVNQILLSVQFFKNFEREKESYPAEKKDIDDKFNDTLKDCKRHAFVTDLVYQRVQDNVGVKAKDQSAVLEPIMPTNYYIGYQSIEANRYEEFQSLKDGSLDYKTLDEDTYRVCVEETQPGFAKLRCVDDHSRRQSDIPTVARIQAQPLQDEEDQSPGYQFMKELSDHIEKTTGVAPLLEVKKASPPMTPSSPMSPTAKDNSGTDTDDYGYVAPSIALNDLLVKLGRSNISKLPSKCFKTVTVPVLREDEDPDEPYPLPTDLEEERTYCLSKYFMHHFSATFYEMTREMGITDMASAAQVIHSRIRCRSEKIESDQAKELWVDFIPCIEVPFWPDSGIEWYLRPRKRFQHKATGTVYHWPPKELITVGIGKDGNPVENGPQWIGASLIPSSIVRNEWQWQFVKMEHYLLKSLNHPQTRFFLFVTLLFRTHLADSTGLDISFLRHHFFWMLEKDPASWQDETLGDKFVLFVKTLLSKLEKKELQNYFIKKENLLQQLAKHKLAEAHAKLFRINENIVPHLLQAVHNLQCLDRSFYPLLNIDSLIQILTTDISLKLVLPSQMVLTERSNSVTSSKKSKKSNKDNFQRIQEAKLHRSKIHQKQANVQDRAEIDVEMQIPKTFNEPRKKALLTFFINHFIALAKKSNEFRAYGQSLMLVLQSQNMVKLLEEMGYGDTKETTDFKIQLEKLRSISRVGADEYWKVNWGCQEPVSSTSLLHRMASQSKKNLPLPDPPAQRSATPILGTESPDITFIEVHAEAEDKEENSTDL